MAAKFTDPENYFIAGDDFQSDGDFKTFVINQKCDADKNKEHLSKVEIYGDESLRDYIVQVLNDRKA